MLFSRVGPEAAIKSGRELVLISQQFPAGEN
jgi:hypothetical protein